MNNSDNQIMEAPFMKSYWVVLGNLLAGCFPGGPGDEKKLKVRESLINCGINYIINLTEEDEVYSDNNPFDPYEDHIQAIAKANGKKVTIERMPIKDMGVPERTGMMKILDTIDAEIDKGRAVYVHCMGGMGRTGTVVGCYLARHGMASGEGALKMIKELRKKTKNPDSASPQTQEQIDMVMSWVEYE